jgi:hypothetical protein
MSGYTADFALVCEGVTDYGVPQREGGVEFSAETMVERVAARLSEIIGPDDCATYAGHLIFAICVRSIECWLLPLWETGVKVAKTTGCLGTLNQALARKNQPTIADEKKVPPYENASRGYRKRATLLEEGPKNPSLGVFLDDLKARAIVLEEVE